MATKKVTSKDITPKDVTQLSFFECQKLIREIEVMAEENDGVLTDEQVEALVEAQTQTPVKLKSFCNYMKLLESTENICKQRKKEINETQKRIERVRERMSAYLAKFVEAQGKSYHVQEYELKTRVSKSVRLIDGYDDPLFCTIETITVATPDKAVIKKALLDGEEVPGAELVEKLNLSIT